MKYDILVIGNQESLLGFQMIGLDILYWNDENTNAHILESKISNGVNIIFYTEDIAYELKQIITLYEEKIYPLFIPIPSISGSQGFGKQNLLSLVKNAIGISSIEKNEDEN